MRIENWCRRIRHRKGYGVHSPSDYFLITSVIYENLPFYAYQELHEQTTKRTYREKVDKLVFRLANYFQPEIWVNDDPHNLVTEKYIHAACPHALQMSIDEIIQSGKTPGLVHLGSTDYEKHFDQLLPLVGNSTIFIIGEPNATKEKSEWWKNVIADKRTGVTFDLFDLGLVFFDKKRFKEHRIVNFF